MKRAVNILRSQEGSGIVIAALAMTVMLIMSAFAVDLGICYLETSDLQNAVDAAALAAGRLLPAQAGDGAALANISQTAAGYLEKNGFGGSEINVEPCNEINGKYTSVKVSANTQAVTSFSRIIGINSLNIKRSAAAQISPVTKMDGIVPLSIETEYLQAAIAGGNTNHMTLKFGAATGCQGSFGAVNLSGTNGGGANDYNSNLLNGYGGEIQTGDVLAVEPGNMSGPTFDSFWSRYDSCTHFSGQGGCTYDHFVKDCPRVVFVPVVQDLSSGSVEISGFAAFILESGTGNGVESTVTGSFVNVVTAADGYDRQGPGGGDDFGVYSVHLSY